MKPEIQSEPTITDKIAYRELERFYNECISGPDFNTLDERQLRILRGSVSFENWKFQEAMDLLGKNLFNALKSLGQRILRLLSRKGK